MTELAPVFEGCKFSTVSNTLYQRWGIVLFGLQVEDKRRNGSARILLNPSGERVDSELSPCLE